MVLPRPCSLLLTSLLLWRGVSVASEAAARVRLVMADTRAPRLQRVAHGSMQLRDLDAEPHQVALYANIKWACLHGYELRFHHVQGGGCAHRVWGRRHPSYCKLAAVASALEEGRPGSPDWVVYLDSDTSVVNVSAASPRLTELRAMLRRYGASAEAVAGRGEPSQRPNQPQPAAFFSWDSPYTLGPNAGFFAIRNCAAARAMLRAWWNIDHGPFGTVHPFEQRALQWSLMHAPRFAPLIQTLSLRSIDPAAPDLVVHRDHNLGNRARTWALVRAAAEAIVREAELGAGPGAIGPASVREVRRQLKLLRQSVRRKNYGTREAVLRVVMAAVGDDLRSIGYSDGNSALNTGANTTAGTTAGVAAAPGAEQGRAASSRARLQVRDPRLT